MLPANLLPMLTDDLPKRHPATLPGELELTVTPLFNRIAVQLTVTETLVEDTTIEGHVDIRKNGVWHNGTELYRCYDTDDYYANCFNLLEDTRYRLRITVRLRDTTTHEVVKQYVHDFVATTRSSATPQSNETMWYIDPIAGNNNNNGLTPTTPFQWLNKQTWQPGDTIVIMNGDFSAASTAQRRLLRAKGTAENWIRVIPYAPAGEAARVQSPVTLNGPWTDESGTYPNTWSMNVGAKKIGVVRDEDTGYEIQPCRYLDNASPPTEPGIKQGNVDGHACWHLEIDGIGANEHKLYIRTVDGDEPPDDKFIGGYQLGLVMTACEYVVLDGMMFGLSQDIKVIDALQVPGNARGLSINTLSQTGNENSGWIILRNCDVRDASLDIDNGTGNGVGLVLLDNTTVRRDGLYETLYERVDYSESDPYVSNYGYGIEKSSLWDRSSVMLRNTGPTVIRNCEIRGFSGPTPTESSVNSYVKHLDVYGCHMHRGLLAWINISANTGGPGSAINGAFWNNRLDHGAEPLAASPINHGPIWFFANYGDGMLHLAYKIGLQTSGYDDTNGHGFKIIANNSFTVAGFMGTGDTTIGMIRFQGGHSGDLVYNDVQKIYSHTHATTEIRFSHADSSGYVVDPDRVNLWRNGIAYFVNTAARPVKPIQRWNGQVYDVIGGSPPPADEFIWQDYLIGWSANPSPGEAEIDPFPVSAAAGLNANVTRKSVYVRGITDLAGDDEGDPVALEDLPIGCFPLRAAE